MILVLRGFFFAMNLWKATNENSNYHEMQKKLFVADVCFSFYAEGVGSLTCLEFRDKVRKRCDYRRAIYEPSLSLVYSYAELGLGAPGMTLPALSNEMPHS